jgi:rhodanese-related sulfurtransferase
MAIANITPFEAKKLRDRGAVIIDIREAAEFAREHIDGAQNFPLSKIGSESAPAGDIVIYHCKSGMRTQTNAARLPSEGCEAYILNGGIEAWKRAGMAVEAGKTPSLGFDQRILIGAILIVLAGLVASLFS